MTQLPPPPSFVSNSAALLPSAAAQAVAPMTPPGAAADLSPMEKGGAAEAPAVNAGSMPAGATDLLGCRIDDVGQIFHFARMLVAQARIEPGKYSPEAVAVAKEIRDFEDGYYLDPPPLFLQTPGGILQVLRGR